MMATKEGDVIGPAPYVEEQVVARAGANPLPSPTGMIAKMGRGTLGERDGMLSGMPRGFLNGYQRWRLAPCRQAGLGAPP